ncbi:MAG TPA: hypothetical protein VMH81_11755 [Bryobacteraceae bacterium]|nr:hypothetical protein [Bryobacteraceae bacterium]
MRPRSGRPLVSGGPLLDEFPGNGGAWTAGSGRASQAFGYPSVPPQHFGAERAGGHLGKTKLRVCQGQISRVASAPHQTLECGTAQREGDPCRSAPGVQHQMEEHGSIHSCTPACKNQPKRNMPSKPASRFGHPVELGQADSPREALE